MWVVWEVDPLLLLLLMVVCLGGVSVVEIAADASVDIGDDSIAVLLQ